MNKHHGIYKFVRCDTNEIIYIGKTNNNLKSRVEDHLRGKGIDEKFNAYKGNYKIYVAFLPNSVETDIIERALINQYKPVLNGTDNQAGMSNLIQICEPDWIEFETAFPKIENNSKVKTKKSKILDPEKCRPDDIYLGSAFGWNYYLSNTYSYKEKGHRINEHYFESRAMALKYAQEIVSVCRAYGQYNEHNKEYSIPGKCGKNLDFSYQSEYAGMSPLLICTKNGYGTEKYVIIGGADGWEDVVYHYYVYSESVDLLASVIDDFVITDKLKNPRQYYHL